MTGLIHIGDAAAQVIRRLLAMRTSKSPLSIRLQKDPKMRMHKFQRRSGEFIWLDLDSVVAVHDHGAEGSSIWINRGVLNFIVDIPSDDVLALISPPATPDTYESDLLKTKQKQGQDGKVEGGGWGGSRDRLKAAPEPPQGDFEDRPMTAEEPPYYDLSSLDQPPPAEGLRAVDQAARLDEVARLVDWSMGSEMSLRTINAIEAYAYQRQMNIRGSR